MKLNSLHKTGLMVIVAVCLTVWGSGIGVYAADVPDSIKNDTESFSDAGNATAIASLVCQNPGMAEDIVIIALDTNASIAKPLISAIELAQCLPEELLEKIQKLVNEVVAKEETGARKRERKDPYGQ